MNVSIGNPGNIVRMKKVGTLFKDSYRLIFRMYTWEHPSFEVNKDSEGCGVTVLWWNLDVTRLPEMPFMKRQRQRHTIWRFLAAGSPYEKALSKADKDVRIPNGPLERAYRMLRFRWSA